MNVGDYVRTDKGILKVRDDRPFKDDKNKLNYLTYGNYTCVLKENIIKSSPNIIDLIEKKDIIKYHFNGYDYISEVFEYKNDLWVKNENNMFDISEINIKSIITKEQFEAMKYKIKE